jgi:hypothetical protein
MDLARAALLLVPAALLTAGRLEPWHLCVTSALLATASSFFGPAFSASLPNLVAREDLAAANGLTQTSGALGGLLGPALGGVLVAVAGAQDAVLIDAASFGVSALLLALSRIPTPAAAATGRASLGRDLLEGVRFFRSTPFLWGLMLLSAALNLFAAPLQVLLPGLAKDVLRAGPAGFGTLEAMIPAGFVVGGLAVGLVRGRRIGLLVIWMVVAAGLCFAGLGLSRAFAPTAALLAAAGAALALTNILVFTVLQTRIPGEIQGRAFGALGTLSGGLRPLGLAATAPAVALLGVPAMFAICGAAVALGGLAGFLVPGLSTLERGDAGAPSRVDAPREVASA